MEIKEKRRTCPIIVKMLSRKYSVLKVFLVRSTELQEGGMTYETLDSLDRRR